MMKFNTGLAAVAIGYCVSLYTSTLFACQSLALTVTEQNVEEQVSNSTSQAVRIVIDAERGFEFDLYILGRPIREIEAEVLCRLYQYFDSSKNGLLEAEEAFYFPDLSQLQQQLWNPFGLSRAGWRTSDGAEALSDRRELVDRFWKKRLSFVHVGYGKDEASFRLSERLHALLSASLREQTSQVSSTLLHEQFERLDTNRDGQLTAGEIIRDLAYPSCSTSSPKSSSTSLSNVQRFKIDIGQVETPVLEIQSTPFQPLVPSTAEPAVFIRYDRGTGLQMVKSATERLEQLFQELDTDRNLILSSDELETKTARLMRESIPLADLNRDGNLTEQELADWLRVWGEVVRAQIQISVLEQSVGLWEKVDANMDGRLSLAEWLRFEWLEIHDERVASPHRRICITISHGQPLSILNEPSTIVSRSPGALPVAPQWFRAADSNGDQHLQKEEFVGPITLFSRWDRNGDGLVSLAEIE